jgi:DNA-binding CsgD family transcriptional regulator
MLEQAQKIIKEKAELARARKALTEQGLTSQEIASQLGRPEAGVRNIRYRMNLKREKKESLQARAEALLLAKYLRDEKEVWVPRLVV